MAAICRWIDRINLVGGTIAAWLIAPLIGAMCFEVVARYVFNAPTIWAYELAYLLTGSGWLLGMAYTLSRSGHIRIDVLYLNMPVRTRAFVDLAGYLLLLLPFILWLTSTLDDKAIAAFQSGEKTGQSAWNPPIWPFRAVFLVSFALLGLQVVAEVLRCLRTVFGARQDQGKGP